jgi:hypothetical protein
MEEETTDALAFALTIASFSEYRRVMLDSMPALALAISLRSQASPIP